MDRMTAMDLLDWAQRAQNIEDGADDWKETYGVESLNYFVEEDYTTVWKRGYSVLFDILMVRIFSFYLHVSMSYHVVRSRKMFRRQVTD
jgi:hypothetical protein